MIIFVIRLFCLKAVQTPKSNGSIDQRIIPMFFQQSKYSKNILTLFFFSFKVENFSKNHLKIIDM